MIEVVIEVLEEHDGGTTLGGMMLMGSEKHSRERRGKREEG